MQLNLSKYKNKGLVGLENLGNTCFLNSCIQVINNTIELNCLFDDDGYKSHIKDDLPESTIINEWEDLRKVMWSGNGVVAPRKFVNSVQTIAKKKDRDLFTGWVQNDLPEFLQFFIECMHNSISRSVNITINGNPENIVDNLAVKCYQTLKEYYNREYSEILDLFYGISFSELISLKDNKVLSVKPECYFMIDLPVCSNDKEASNLIECFDLLTMPEYLEGENAWYNEKTKEKENVKKQHSFWNFPNIIVISLKRFSADGSSKKMNLIDFPINDLDLSNFVRGYNANTFKYDLFGICNHVGGVSGGHYTCFVKNIENNWIHYNDQVVEKVTDPKVIVTPMAYCLFYRKKNNLL
tara:strand:+ start:2084 stop:3142 length:1059 start_codon:yes stop_codon:yes gene_type:complete